MSALLHPTPGSILNQFTTGKREVYPHLAFPFYHPLNGRTVTFAGDGESVLVWTRRRLPGYRDWLADSGPGDFSPAKWVADTISGAAYPLPRCNANDPGPVRMIVSGYAAFLPRWVVVALGAFDTCRVGHSRRRPAIPGHPLAAVSLHWTLGSMAGEGLVICAPTPPLKPITDNQ